MFSSTAFVIRRATADDDDVVRNLAALDSQAPLTGPVLLGELRGSPAAAISLEGNRVVADPFRHTAELIAHLRVRAFGIEAATRTPSLRDRIRAGIHIAPRSPVLTRAAA